VHYIEYPQILRKIQPLQIEWGCGWLDPRHAAAGTAGESQTSGRYQSSNEQFYELIRICGRVGGAADQVG
jgi:hypothetical protein